MLSYIMPRKALVGTAFRCRNAEMPSEPFGQLLYRFMVNPFIYGTSFPTRRGSIGSTSYRVPFFNRLWPGDPSTTNHSSSTVR